MRLHIVLTFVILLTVGCIIPAFAAEQPAPLPAYPGSRVEFELNLTHKDFLPVIRQVIMEIPKFLPAMLVLADGPPAKTEKREKDGATAERHVGWVGLIGSAAKDLESALADLRAVSVMRYRLPEGAESEKIADFYLQKLGLTKGWMSTLRLEPSPGTTVRLYVRPDLEGTFGFVAEPSGVVAIRTEGKIDFTAITKWAAKFAPMVMSERVRKVEEHPPAGKADKATKLKEVPDSQKGQFDVVLVSPGEKKGEVTEAVAKLFGYSMLEASSFVGRTPTSLITGIPKERAANLKSKLEALGATVKVKPSEK